MILGFIKKTKTLSILHIMIYKNIVFSDYKTKNQFIALTYGMNYGNLTSFPL